MTYAFIHDVPADEHLYGQVRTKLGDVAPDGLVAHVVYKHEGGLRYVDVWESRADWDRFREERVDPAVGEVLAGLGIPHDETQATYEDIDVIDCWIGDRAISEASPRSR